MHVLNQNARRSASEPVLFKGWGLAFRLVFKSAKSLLLGGMFVFSLTLTPGNLRAQTTATPTISPTSGTAAGPFSVILSDTTSGATIYYTLDGTIPSATTSPSVTTGGKVLISNTATLKALAVATGYTNSAVATASYQVGMVAAGQYHTVSVKSDGTVWAWGYNVYGQIGDGTTTQRNSAVQVLVSGTPLAGVVAVAAGAYHSVALKSDGSVLAWGLNSSGQCGNNTTTECNNPVQVLKSDGSNLSNIVAICAGAYHNLALDTSGNVWAWGLNTNGQLGDGGTALRTEAEQLTTLTGVTVQSLCAGSYHSLLLTRAGGVMAWGLDTNGQLGDGLGKPSQETSPEVISVPVASPGYITALAAGAEHTVAIDSNNTVWTWGYNSSGQLGNNSIAQSNIPVNLSLTNIAAIEAGYTHSLAITTSGTVIEYCWRIRRWHDNSAKYPRTSYKLYERDPAFGGK
jgi:alpha-tubulin suppressor-like RCC1 family protein